MEPFPFDFRTRVPGPPLDRAVASIWYARGTIPYTRERIAPTGSTVAVFVLGDPILETAHGRAPLRAERGFLIGPHDRPVYNEPTGETFAVGIVGSPVGCEALYGLKPASLRGRVLDLEAAWPAATALREALLAASSPEAMLDVVEAHLIAGLRPAVPGIGRCARAVAMLEADPARPIAEIADGLGISHGHLDREFTRVVGLSPRALARLLRVRRLLEGLDVRGAVAWAELAHALGWFDQSHLIRDFKRHTGVTPSAYLAAQRETFGAPEPGEAAGFVPEP